MSRTAWRFYDDVLDETYFWPVNPKEDSGSHAITKAFNYQAQAAQRRTSGNVDTVDALVSVQAVEQSAFSYSGFVYDQQQFDALVSWCNRGYPIYLTDDLGREFLIYVTGLELSRVRSRQNPFKHSYQFTGIILEEL